MKERPESVGLERARIEREEAKTRDFPRLLRLAHERRGETQDKSCDKTAHPEPHGPLLWRAKDPRQSPARSFVFEQVLPVRSRSPEYYGTQTY
jgi:hypothetical protein